MINDQVVQITEILSRSVQGRTFPFICRGEDGRLYYVKGSGAGRKGLISEWLASSLARAFGLPVAESRIVDVPYELSLLSLPDFDELGAGHAFGSLLRENVVELTLANAALVDAQVRRDVAVFDWWVKNEDRVLTVFGGNVNLLWDIDRRELVVIDYNLAFDDDFDADHFLRAHVFASDWNTVFQDFVARPAYEAKLRKAMAAFDEACDRMPDEWLEVGPGVPSGFMPDDARKVLDRVDLDDFWNKT